MARMRHLAIVLAVLAAGCASHTQIAVGQGAASGTQLGIDVRSGSAVGAIVAIGVLGATIYGQGADTADPPPLAGSRVVREQDCTRPLEDPSANLRCR
jgi:hypothetical protein